MKKNVLIFGTPVYAFLDFYKKYFDSLSDKFNFYVLSDDTGYETFVKNKLENLKKNNKINNYYILSLNKFKNKKLYLNKLQLIYDVKKIYKEIANINFEKIIISSSQEIIVNYLIQKIKKKTKAKLIGLPIHNFKIKNYMVEINKDRKVGLFFIFKEFFAQINFKLTYLINLISSFILFKEMIYSKDLNFEYPVYCKNIDLFISKNVSEIYLYNKKFKNLDSMKLFRKNSCTCVSSPNKKLLVIPKIKLRIKDILVDEYSKNIYMLNNIFKFSEIDIKPHPRDDTDICDELSKKLKRLNFKVNILEKNPIKINYCEYSCALGFTSTILRNALSECNNIISFGILRLGNWTNSNPTPKNLQGDFLSFKSGIIWIEETKNIEKLNFNQLQEMSQNLKSINENVEYKKVSLEEILEL
jgi:hypothetical protein